MASAISASQWERSGEPSAALCLQTHQRSMLATAYERVKQHEDHRCEVLRQIVHSFLHAYK